MEVAAIQGSGAIDDLDEEFHDRLRQLPRCCDRIRCSPMAVRAAISRASPSPQADTVSQESPVAYPEPLAESVASLDRQLRSAVSLRQ